MESSESLERWVEGLARAASCCRELGVMTNINSWKDLSKQLLIMRDKGMKIYKEPALKEHEILKLSIEIEMAQKAALAANGL